MGSGHVRRRAVSGMMRKICGGCQIAERLMGPDVIIRVLPVPLGSPQRGEVQFARVRFKEFFGVGPIGAFHRPIELGRARREDEEPNALLLTGLLKGRGELTAAIDLNGPDRHGHPPL